MSGVIFKLREDDDVNVVRFYLKKIDGDIYLNALDCNDEWWSVLAITKDGYLYLDDSLDEELGLELDEEGRILMKEDV